MKDEVQERAENWLNDLCNELNDLKKAQRRCIGHNAIKSAAMYAALIHEKENILEAEENIYHLVMSNQ